MRSTTGILLVAAMLAAGLPDKGFYLSAGVGRAEEDPGKSNGINIALGLPPAADIVHLEPDSVEVDNGDTAWSVGAGYRFSKYFAAEVLGGLHLGARAVRLLINRDAARGRRSP
ncbi:MAG TPA: hypothetical protein VFZ95_09695 [Steroidobacteraceae bacterium]